LLTGGKIWRLIQSYEPDHLVVLGDVMYTDYEALGRVTPDTAMKIVREYDLLSRDQHWKNLLRSVKDFSITYDDHDYGGDNGDRTFPFKEVGQAAFRNFTAAAFEGFRTNATDAVYSSTTVHTKLGRDEGATDFIYKVVLLDGRSNKDPRGTANGDFLGEEQWQWLAEELLDPTADAILLGSGIQVLGEDQIVEETWSAFPQARRRLLTLITVASQLTNVVLLSGDVHRAEVSRVSCALQGKSPEGSQAGETVPLWELTSSGLTHTIMHRTNDSAETSREEYIAKDNSSSLEIPIRLRSSAVILANRIYEVRACVSQQ
jgi:alkaline phosphatase D